MKKISSILFAIILLISCQQESSNYTGGSITEGKVVYDIIIEADEESSLQMMPNEATFYFKDGIAKIDLVMGMGMMNMSYITDGNKETFKALINFIGKKYEIIGGRNSFNQLFENKKFDIKSTPETKSIEGVESSKIKLTVDGKESEAFFANDISVGNIYWNMPYNEIQKLLTEFTVNTEDGTKIKFKLRTIDENTIDTSIFETPEGYEKLTEEDFKKMMNNAA